MLTFFGMTVVCTKLRNRPMEGSTSSVHSHHIIICTIFSSAYSYKCNTEIITKRHIQKAIQIWHILASHTHTHTHPFNGPFSGTTQVSRCQKGGTNLDFTEARDSEWQWHQLGQMQVCTLLQTENHTSIPPLSFLQAGCVSCRPTNSVKALPILLHILLALKWPIMC